MTSHSEHGAYIRGYSDAELYADSFASASATRDAVVNNLVHLYDESTQALGAYVLEAGATAKLASPSTARYRLIDDLPPMKFPLRVHPTTGNSMIVVPWLRGYTDAAGTASFRIALRFHNWPDAEPILGVSVCSGSTTSTTATDITLSPAKIYIPAAVIARLRTIADSPYRTLDSLQGDGSLGGGTFLLAKIGVWAMSSAGGSHPTITGLSWREFMGE